MQLSRFRLPEVPEIAFGTREIRPSVLRLTAGISRYLCIYWACLCSSPMRRTDGITSAYTAPAHNALSGKKTFMYIHTRTTPNLFSKRRNWRLWKPDAAFNNDLKKHNSTVVLILCRKQEALLLQRDRPTLRQNLVNYMERKYSKIPYEVAYNLQERLSNSLHF